MKLPKTIFYILLIPGLLYFTFPCNAQLAAFDLEKMNSRSEALRYENTPESARLSRAVLTNHARIPQNSVITATAWINLGYALIELDRMDSAHIAIDSATQCIEKNKLTPLRCELFVLKGYYLDEKDKLNEALRNYFSGLELCQIKKKKGVIYNLIGITYRRLKDFDNALKYYNLAYGIGEEIHDTIRMAKSLNNIGSIWYNRLDFEKARSFYEKSLQLREPIRDSVGILSSLGNIAMIYEEEKKYEKALEIHRMILESQYSKNHPIDIITSTINIGNLELKLKNEKAALQWFEKGLVLSDSLKRFFYTAQINQSLARYYYSVGDYKKAFGYQKQLIELNDSILQESSRRNAQELEARFQNRENEKEIALLNEKNKVTDLEKTNAELELRQKNNTLWLIGALGVCGLLLAMLLFYRNRIQKGHNAQLSVMLDEKNVLLKEIHHRVKNNLQLVSSLLSLQSNATEQEETTKLLKVSQDRIHSLALLHEKLYQSEQLKAISFRDYISELAVYLGDSFNCRERHIEIKTEVDEIAADIDQLVPCGLILNELITNSLKYAFEKSSSGIIHITARQIAASCIITVSDNGCGLSDKPATGIGLKLVGGLVRQLKGTLRQTIPETGGVSFTINFPLQHYTLSNKNNSNK